MHRAEPRSGQHGARGALTDTVLTVDTHNVLGRRRTTQITVGQRTTPVATRTFSAPDRGHFRAPDADP